MSKRGRKCKYETHVKPRLETIRAWRRRGLTEEEIDKRLGISHQSRCEYKKKYPEFFDVLKDGLEDAIATVENALYERAIGFKILEPRVLKDGKIIYVNKQVCGDITAALAFLNKRAGWHSPDTGNSHGNVADMFRALRESSDSKPEKPGDENDLG